MDDVTSYDQQPGIVDSTPRAAVIMRAGGLMLLMAVPVSAMLELHGVILPGTAKDVADTVHNGWPLFFTIGGAAVIASTSSFRDGGSRTPDSSAHSDTEK